MCGVAFGMLIIVLRLVLGPAWAGDEQGVFTLFAVLFVFVGAQFFGLGLLGEYIGRIYMDVRDRPRFFVQEVRGVEPPQAGEKITAPNHEADIESADMKLNS